jgi:peptide/nickel transport system permease protein
LGFVRRRILISLVVFFATLNLDFMLPRLVPGNVAEIFASGTKLPAHAILVLSQKFGLGQPLSVQYILYLKGIFATWPPYFGFSYQFYPQTVSNLIAIRLPWTILLVATSMLLSFNISYILAGVSALRRRGKFELASLYTSIVFWSIPAFWTGMILLWVFSVWSGALPISGNSSFNTTSPSDYYWSVVTHAILPIATLTIVVFGQNYFILRGAAQDTLRSDYVLASKARGLKDNTIAFGYIMRNSLLPSVSLLGYSIASIISAAVLVEGVFGYAGVGDLIVDGILNRDYPVLEGSFFYLTLIVLVGGLIGDFLLLKLDPRLRR